MRGKIETLLSIKDKAAFAKANKELAASLKTKEEKEAFQQAFAEALAARGKRIREIEKEVKLCVRMKEISEIVSLSYIAKTYFQKSKEWLYQRINGYIVNGKESKFTDAELNRLDFALQDISKKIGSFSIRA